jgi:hypothetical protein
MAKGERAGAAWTLRADARHAGTGGLIGHVAPNCRPRGGRLAFRVLQGGASGRIDVRTARRRRPVRVRVRGSCVCVCVQVTPSGAIVFMVPANGGYARAPDNAPVRTANSSDRVVTQLLAADVGQPQRHCLRQGGWPAADAHVLLLRCGGVPRAERQGCVRRRGGVVRCNSSAGSL